jgi:MOSC domain-containing protein YiiM
VGRTGAYLSVVTGGTVRPGDPIEVVARPDHTITVPDTFRAFMGVLDAAERVLAAGCLVELEAAELRATVARRRRSGAELDA